MNKRLLSTGLALALGVGYSAAALAQVKPEILVKQRQAAMTLQGKYFGPMGGMAQGKVPYNADIVAFNCRDARRAEPHALGRVRPSQQGCNREERRAAGDLERAGQVQDGAGQLPERSAGGSSR